MPTIKQKKVALKLVEVLKSDESMTGAEILENIGYSKAIAKNPKMVLESVGVKEALDELGFNEATAKQVVKEIMLSKKVDPNARLKATDQVFKVVGSYAPEKHANMNIEISDEDLALAREVLGRLNEK